MIHRLVVNKPAPCDLTIGEYVFASRWSDCDPSDPWAVGHATEIGPDFVVVGDVNQRRWRKAMRISKEQGQNIIELYPSMERCYIPQKYKAIARVFGKRVRSA